MDISKINPELASLDTDYLYHLGLTSKDDLAGRYGDVRYVCMGGSPVRAEVLAEKACEALGVTVPKSGLRPDGKTERFSMYRVGPVVSTGAERRGGDVISVSHGMGMPSLSILMHEITKLLYYAGAEDPAYMRVGTSGGIGVPPGTVVLAKQGINSKLKPDFALDMLGKTHHFPTELNAELTRRIFDARGDIEAVIADTCGTDDFYEGQNRSDGALVHPYTEEEKMAYLRRAHRKGVRNFEMESPEYAAFCLRAGIRAAAMSVTLLDRLQGDQVTSTPAQLAEFSDRAQRLAIQFIKEDLKR